jgi:uncharacterized membrane protein YgcG
MLSLWPAGLPSNGEGTIDWAGGLIDWSSPYMQQGYYYAMVNDVKVECYDPPEGAQGSGKTSYLYTDTKATNDTIEMTSKSVVLKSLYASGDNPDYNPNGDSASPSSTPESIPGVSGAGARNDDSSNGNGGSGTSSGASSSSSSGTSSGFSQGTGSQGSSGGSKIQPERLGGSVLAILVAVGFMLCW